MTDPEEFEDGEPSAIGVGMGGSCPVCRAPVDLGQEFCLECGSPIRFTPRQRRQQRTGSADASRQGAARMAPPKSGFPWIPFLVVLALIGGGVAFALVDDGGESSRSSGRDETEPALPEITNSVPQETTSDTETTTVDDCATVDGLEGTQPAVPGSDGSLDDADGIGSVDGGEQIPEVSDGSTQDPAISGFDDPSVPSTDASGEFESDDEGTVTVDRDGNLCSGDATSTDPGVDPGTDPGALDPATDPTSTDDPGATTAASGDWPAGEDGWTVIVAGFDTEARAAQRAADVQEDGFADGGVLFSSDFASLCPGIYVVFSGTFDDEDEAEARLEELRDRNYAGMYVREIRRGGPKPSGCTTVRS